LYSHAEGRGTIASGSYSHAEGQDTIAGGYWSHAAGLNADATHQNTYVWSDGQDINSTTTKQYTVYAANGIRLLGGMTYTSDGLVYSSDLRLKQNIEPLTDALSKVEQINGVYYDRMDVVGVPHVRICAGGTR